MRCTSLTGGKTALSSANAGTGYIRMLQLYQVQVYAMHASVND
jgi:hypothetical protein